MRSPRRLVLLGHPVAHSLSPRFQNAALAAAGLEVRYEAMDVEPHALSDAVARLRHEGAGGNVTVPHKAAVAALCDELRPAAQRTGAVNTFWTDDRGGLIGDNTDVDGFAAAVRALLPAPPAHIVVGVIGAGGAAAAVLAVVEGWTGCTALVHNRTPSRAEALCARFGSVARVSDVAELAERADLVVNASSIGLRDGAVPIDPSRLRSGAVVLDLVYRPGETAWVRAARAAGFTAADGLTMLVEQGAHAFERWFGYAPDRSVMWRAVNDQTGPAAAADVTRGWGGPRA